MLIFHLTTDDAFARRIDAANCLFIKFIVVGAALCNDWGRDASERCDVEKKKVNDRVLCSLKMIV